MLFVRNIDVRGWKLHLRHPGSEYVETDYLSHNNSFGIVCGDGELDIVKAMVERAEVDLEVRDNEDEDSWAPLHSAAHHGHIHVMQYLCEQGADKEARGERDWTPLHIAAQYGRLPVVQYLCEHGVDKRRGVGMAKHHSTGQQPKVTSL